MKLVTLNTLSTDNYKIKPWSMKFSTHDIKLTQSIKPNTWNAFYKSDEFIKNIDIINNFLSELFKSNPNIEVFPYPRLIFSALNTLPLNKIKVVFLAQDPYIKIEKQIPQAMGLAFSVPKGIRIPPSLRNIYTNQLKYKHIDQFPDHGNLTNWVKQGCLLLNTTLTVTKGKSNSHSKQWKKITDQLIKYISNNTNNTVFVLWGKNSYEKKPFIDENKHKIIISSHPSPLSFTKKFRQYPSFKEFDHFGTINNYLKQYKKNTINWKII